MERKHYKLAAVTAQVDPSTNFAEVYGVDGYGNLRHIGDFYGSTPAVANSDRLTQETERIDVAERSAKRIADAAGVPALRSQSAQDERAFEAARKEYAADAQRYPDAPVPVEHPKRFCLSSATALWMVCSR